GNGEFYMDYADYEVAFTAPVNWLVRATGELQNGAQVLTGAERDALDAAASGHEVVHVVTGKDLNNGTVTQPSASGKLTWKFRAANVRDFAIATGDQYVWDATGAVVKDQGGPGKDGSCLIHAVYRQRCRAWRKAARYAQHTIEWVSANLNPYPWPQMTACEGLLGGGMEYPMMTWIGDMGAPSLQQAVIAHELIHMWFPMQVGSDEAAHAWQDEGLTDFVTDFVTADWFQHKKVGERTLQEYVAVARASDHEEPLMRHGDHYETEMAYGFCSYTKPAAMLHQLVGMRGRDQVFGALKSYVQAWSFKHPTPYDLFALLNGALGENLDWYWRTWCFETWHLDQAIAEVQDDGAATTVVIEDLGEAPGPAHVRVTYADESTEDQTVDVHEWLQGKRRAVLHFRAGVIKAVLDPEHTTMDIDPRNNVWRKGG
ncbi:MAG TPA: M1 family aminopeptidase, partial [Planctomycetota bacterium]|nr:M1 family aminopeptidase [Planctomycetota bacterium]